MMIKVTLYPQTAVHHLYYPPCECDWFGHMHGFLRVWEREVMHNCGKFCNARHAAMMEAFETATYLWWRQYEAEAYPAERIMFMIKNPKPQLSDFMKGTY